MPPICRLRNVRVWLISDVWADAVEGQDVAHKQTLSRPWTRRHMERFQIAGPGSLGTMFPR